MFDQVWKNITLATFDEEDDYGIIPDGCLAVTDGHISYVGREKDLPDHSCDNIHDGQGALATPSLIDCHTHLIYGGNRADEFEKRLQGVSYADIAKSGGGILSTVKATRDTPEDDLFEQALYRIKPLLYEGVTVFEIKSGYGLDTQTEEKMLRVATRLRDGLGIRVQRTFLAAHALPPEYALKSDEYIDHICRDMLPDLHAKGLIDAVDGFCETIAFTPLQISRVFDTATSLGLPVKLHAEQLTLCGGTKMAAQYNALSADHVEYVDEDSVKAMADAGMTAVLLPGAFYTLNEKQKPPIDLFRKHHVPMALATDHNPGSSPILSLHTIMNMGCTLFGMTPLESWQAVTKNAARALGVHDKCGVLKTGVVADVAFFNITHPRDLTYLIGGQKCAGVLLGGNYLPFDA